MQDTIQINLPPSDTIQGIQKADSIFPAHDTLIPAEILPISKKIISPQKLFQTSLRNSTKSPDSLEFINRIDSIELQPTDSFEQQPFIIEQQVSDSLQTNNSFLSRNISPDHIPDWYFIIIIAVLFVFSWIRIAYSRFLNILFESSYNYLLASKIFKERSVVQKRFGILFDFMYLLNGSLFLYLLFRHFKWDFIGENSLKQLFVSFGFLSILILIRITTMRIIGHIFDRYLLFTEFLYHFYIYNKLLGLVLLPFILAIPYTQGQLHVILIYSAISVIGIVYFMRLVRAVIFTLKKDVLIFYLILYLCTLEILPVTVIIKLILSLN